MDDDEWAEPVDCEEEIEEDAVSLQKQMLPVLHNMHNLCVKLHNMTFCREQCVNILNTLKG